jgi:MFS family permease
MDGHSRLRWRLSLFMFLLYAPGGAVLPLFSLRLRDLRFEPLEMGWTFAAQPLAALLAPLAAGQMADRWFASERCVAVCAFASGIAVWLLAELHTFASVFAVNFLFWLLMVPALTLGTSLCFAHLRESGDDFGRVRLWGTVGWVVPVWLLSGWFDNAEWLAPVYQWLRPDHPKSEFADMFRLAGLLCGVLGVYALTLPHTPPSKLGQTWLAPLAAMQLLRRRAFALYTTVTLGLCVTIPFTGQVTPLLLEDLGVPRPWLARALTIAQSTEIIALALLPMLLLRLGTRGTMRLGLAAWVTALSLLMIGHPLGLVIGSMTFNGLYICCFLVAGQVFVHRQAQGDIRASAQGLLTFTNGIGLLLGNVLVGAIRALVGGAFAPTFAVAAGIALALMGVFLVGFPPDEANGVK